MVLKYREVVNGGAEIAGTTMYTLCILVNKIPYPAMMY